MIDKNDDMHVINVKHEVSKLSLVSHSNLSLTCYTQTEKEGEREREKNEE